jgi:hypothetical protein
MWMNAISKKEYVEDKTDKDFEIYTDALEPELPLAAIPDFEDRLRGAIREILEASFEKEDPEAFFRTIVVIGKNTLDTKCCSIFLMEEETSMLRFMDAEGGRMGEKTQEAEPYYYIPERKCFTKEERDVTSKQDIEAAIKQYRLEEKKAEHEPEKIQLNEKRVTWTKDKLPMGITAYVVKEGVGVVANGIAVREHPEWLGGYEAAQDEICTSIIEVPLKITKKRNGVEEEKTIGVIKIENHKDSKKISKFPHLRNPKERSRIQVFGPQHKQIISILADSVALAIQELYRDDSYKHIFGIKSLSEALLLLSGPVAGTKNRKIAKLIRDFCKDTIKWDIIGEENCYKRTIDLAEAIAKGLNLTTNLTEIFRELEKFDTLLRSTDVSYREHFLHQFQVFLSGYCIINKNKPFRDLLAKYLAKQGLPNAGIDDVVTCWFLASIFHDSAYSIERIQQWFGSYFGVLFRPPSRRRSSRRRDSERPEELLKELQLTIPWGNIFSLYGGALDYQKIQLIDMLCERIGQYGKGNPRRLQRDVTRLLTDSLVKNQDHGLFGGLILRLIMEDAKTKRIITNEASLAIAIHTDYVYRQLRAFFKDDQTNVKGRIDPHDFPFAFLLVFCDQAQQWGRPKFKELTRGANGDTQEGIRLVSIKIPSGKGNVEFDLKYPDVPDRVSKEIWKHWKSWKKYVKEIDVEFNIGVKS